MKKLITLMTLAISISAAQANVLKDASLITFSPVVTTYIYSALATDDNGLRKAQQILVDGEEFNVSGELTPFLAENVKMVQLVDSEISTAEAIDVLLEVSATYLK